MPCENKATCLTLDKKDIDEANEAIKARRTTPGMAQKAIGRAHYNILEIMNGCQDRRCYRESSLSLNK